MSMTPKQAAGVMKALELIADEVDKLRTATIQAGANLEGRWTSESDWVKGYLAQIIDEHELSPEQLGVED